MSDSESMPPSDGPGSAFRVYITAPGLEASAVLEALCRDNEDAADDDADNFHVEQLEGQSTQAVLQRHRDSDHDETGTHPKLFLVFDSADLAERGALLVGLDEYHGFSDGVRLPPGDANNTISSLSISNEDWYTLRQDVPEEKTAATPVRWFALYDAVPAVSKRDGDDDDDDDDVFQHALSAMNRGLQDVGVSEPDEEGDADELPAYYSAVRAGGRSLDQIMGGHPSYAEENALDPARFAVIDGHYGQEGALLVQVSPERDSFRCRGEVAGEILRWVFINFMTWDEAKAFGGGRGGE
ncbi:hypothetical protein E4U41_003141 [Claviceps citrina]|nr:hypothetical protein E4U41_003141 [Claviceps citrina]